MKNTTLLLMAAALTSFIAIISTNVKADTTKTNCTSCKEKYDDVKQKSIQEKIDKLKNELSKGNSVYSDEELRRLKSELNYYQAFFVNMMAN